MTEPIDARERREICNLLLKLGPDAPTLCEGWTTADLAAHLYLREHFRRTTFDRLAAEKRKGLPALVELLRAGAPLIPWRLPRIRDQLNGVEYFIHHEDVRRANGFGPRTDVPELEELCWRTSGFFGRRVARSMAPFALEIVRPDGTKRSFGSGTAAVLTGPPTELILFLGGRRSAAKVTPEGSDEALAALERSQVKL